MKKYTSDHITAYVVSKTGEFGRYHLINNDLPKTYNIDLKTFSYETFKSIQKEIKNSIIFHHVLGHTKNIEFDKSCKCFVINHVVTNIHRLSKFKCNGIISVCKYFADKLEKRTKLRSRIILNGCEDYYSPNSNTNDHFIIGCCQRVVPSKFNTNKKPFPKNCIRHVVGPCSISTKGIKNCVFFGPIFEKQRKLDIIRNFDIYLHDTTSPEGASMALLESLSLGIPVLAKNVGGGTLEIIKNGVNGYLYKSDSELYNLISDFSVNRNKLALLKDSVRKDFLDRLHIKNTVRKYQKIYDASV